MYALCVSGSVSTQGFVWKFVMRYIKILIDGFIHSLKDGVAPLKHIATPEKGPSQRFALVTRADCR